MRYLPPVPGNTLQIAPVMHAATLLLLLLASCTDRSNAADQERGGGTPATALVAQADWGRLDPFYVFNCSAYVDTEAGHFEFVRSYMPDGKLGSVHAIWQTPMLAGVPRIQAVVNTDNGEDFALARGSVLLSWQFIPALRPTSIRSRLSIGDLPFAPDSRGGPVPGMVSTLAGDNSSAMASTGWRDFAGAARDGAVNVRVDLTGAPAGWRDRLYPGYLTGMTVVGNNALARPIAMATLLAVEHQLQLMAAQTNVPRPDDVPRRCARADQVSVSD